MLNTNYIEKLIGLKDVIVKKIENFDKSKHIYIELKIKPQTCPQCGHTTKYIHDYRMQKVKDIDISGVHTYLFLNKRRYVCPHCGKKFQEENTFLGKYQRATNRLLRHIIELLRDCKTMKQVAKETNYSSVSVARMFQIVSYGKPKLPRVIGIDEFRGNSGGEKFNCILTNPKKHKLLDIMPKRNTEELHKYFSQFSNRDQVEVVTMDLSVLFKSVVNAAFPKAAIVADKYHVQRLAQWAFENVRKRIQKELYQESRIKMKHSRRLLLKRKSKLSREEVLEVARLLRYSKELGEAYYLKEKFMDFIHSENIYEAQRRLKEWSMHAMVCDIKEFESLRTTLINWKTEILNMFIYKVSNGFTEGCNNKIKVLKRISYGNRNFDNFRNRILHLT